MKTLRHVLDGPDRKAALKLAYALAAEMMDRRIMPEQERRAWEER